MAWRAQRRGYNIAFGLLASLLWLSSAPHLRAQAGNNNPTGPTGQFNGNVTTAGSYDPYTGGATRSLTDLAIAGTVSQYGLGYTRTWNSRGGNTWRHSFEWSVADVVDLRAGQPIPYTVSFPDGREETFGPPSLGGAWRAGTGTRERFKPLANNLCYLLLPDGGKVEFSAISSSWTECETLPCVTYYSYSFKTEAIIDPYGQRISYSYNPDGTVYRLTEPAGRYLQFGYSGGRLASVTGSDGRTVTYTYTTAPVPGATTPYTLLTSVRYFGDSTLDATYTYEKPNVGSVNGAPLLKTCRDPMYAGPMKNISYTYATANNPNGTPPVYGQILSEKNLTTGQAVSTLTINTAATRTETRGDGQTRTFIYDTSTGLLTSATDFKGVAETRAYDTNLYVNAVTDRRGYTTNFTNNAFTGGVTQVQYPLTPPDATRATVQTVFGYAGCPDPNNQDANNPYYPYSVTNELGKTTTFLRDTSKRVTQINYPDGGYETFGYNGFGQVTSHRMTSGGTETFSYGPTGLLLSRTPAATPSDPNPAAHPTLYAYYTSGPQKDRLYSVTDPRGNSTWFYYNTRGQVTKVTNPGGTFRLTAYNADGTVASATDELNHTTGFEYDDYKRVWRTTDPLGKATVISYAPSGLSSEVHTTANPRAVTSATGKVVHYAYDGNWRRTIQRAGITADDAWTYWAYDANGNTTKVTDPRGNFWTLAYDARNRKTSATDPAPFTNQITRWEYDKAGNLLKETRPDLKYRTWDLYDAMNRIKHSTGFLNDPASYVYDLAGNLTRMTDSKGANYDYQYDVLNRKIVATYPPDASGATRWEAWTFDFAGNVATVRNPVGWIQTFTYDNRNRPTNAAWNTTYAGTVATALSYDAASRVTSIVRGATTVGFGYDDANRKIWEDQTLSGLPTRRVNTPVNDDGLRQGLSLSGIFSLAYDYTKRNQLYHITNPVGTQWFEYTYDANGNLKKRQDKNQGLDSTNFDYDELNRPTLCDQTGASDILFDRSYQGYDTVGRLQYTYRQQQANKGERYSYDDAGQLQSVLYNANNVNTSTPSGQDRTVSYGNTALNRTSQTDNGVVTNYTPNGMNQYSAVTGQAPAYDGNFHLSQYAGWAYLFDADRRMTSATTTGQSAQFIYDGLGRCVRRTINGVATVFTYDGWKQVAEWSGTGVFQAWNIYGPGADEILVRYSTSFGYHHYHADAQGNVKFLLNGTNTVVEKYTYDAFGQPKITDANGANPRTTSNYGNRFLFTGREWLAPLGLYDYRNRMYQPQLGRFLQTDPLGFAAGDANLFRYCAGDPVNRVDPTGLQDSEGDIGRRFFRNYWLELIFGPGVFTPPSPTPTPAPIPEHSGQFPNDGLGGDLHGQIEVRDANGNRVYIEVRYDDLRTLAYLNYTQSSRPPKPTVNFGAGMGGTYLAAFQNFINGSAGHMQTAAEHNTILYLSSQNPPDYLRVPPQPEGEARPTRNVPGRAVNPASQAASVREWRDLGRRMRETHNFTRPDPHPQNYGYPGR